MRAALTAFCTTGKLSCACICLVPAVFAFISLPVSLLTCAVVAGIDPVPVMPLPSQPVNTVTQQTDRHVSEVTRQANTLCKAPVA